MKNLVILISGGGTNMQAVADACADGRINARMAAVISSNYEAGGLKRAETAGIPAYVCSLKDFASNTARDLKIKEIADGCKADFIVLAGYLGIFTPVITDAYKKRIINIHPALLPKFGGKGFFGLNVHKAVLDAGERVTGATAHYADEGIDTGEIIASRTVEVLPGDTPETLAKRVLFEAEHPLLVEVLKNLCR